MVQYALAIDIGESQVAAATARISSDGVPIAAPVVLSRHGDTVPAVAFFAGDSTVLFGDEAAKRGREEPRRLVTGFCRSAGDHVPLIAAGQSHTAEELIALTALTVVDKVVESKGTPPSEIVLTYPPQWGPHRRSTIRSALEAAGLADVEMLSSPEAAAFFYEEDLPREQGATAIVYDLGGATFQAAIVTKDSAGSLSLTRFSTDETIGGVNVDDDVFAHVISQCDAPPSVDVPQPDAAIAEYAQLRGDCQKAKEDLSADAETSIRVRRDGESTRIRLTRSELEDMIQPEIHRTVDIVEDLLDASDTSVDRVSAIILAGGSSRIPFIVQALSERFSRRLLIDENPSLTTALGAARWLLDQNIVNAPARESDTPAELRDPEADLTPAPAGASLISGIRHATAADRNRTSRRTVAIVVAMVLTAGALFYGTFAALKAIDGRVADSGSVEDSSEGVSNGVRRDDTRDDEGISEEPGSEHRQPSGLKQPNVAPSTDLVMRRTRRPRRRRPAPADASSRPCPTPTPRQKPKTIPEMAGV